MRKVLLIDPGQSFAEGGSRHALRQTPHIGLSYLASCVRDIADVRVLDMPLIGATEVDLVKALDGFGEGDIAGVTAATFNMREALDAAHIVKSVNSDILVMFGGPHVNAFPTDALTRSADVDVAVVGEGEVLMRHAVKNYGNRDFTFDLPGMVFRKEGKITYRPLTAEWSIGNLDDLPFPDWDFLGLNRYWKRYSFHFDAMMQLAPLSTNRGCPYTCTFCDPNNLTAKLRVRSPQNTVDEIARAVERNGVRYFYLTDSVMSIPKPRFREFCRLMKESGLAQEVALLGQANVNAIDEEMITGFKEAGGEYIFFGLESGNEEVLAKNGKRITREKVMRCTGHAHDIGLSPRGSFILGLPFETEKSAMDTIEFATETLKLHSANFFILDFYPGTAAMRLLQSGGGGFVMPAGGIDWASYVPSRNRAKVGVNDLTPERLSELHTYAKSKPLPYHDKDLALREAATEFLYLVETGRHTGEGRVQAYGRLQQMATKASDKGRALCRERLDRARALMTGAAAPTMVAA